MSKVKMTQLDPTNPALVPILGAREQGREAFGANLSSPDPLERTIAAVAEQLQQEPLGVLGVREIGTALIQNEERRRALEVEATPITIQVINVHGVKISTTLEQIRLIAIPESAVAMTFEQVIALWRDYALRMAAQRALDQENLQGLAFMRAIDAETGLQELDTYASNIQQAVEIWIRYSFTSARYLFGRFTGTEEVTSEQLFSRYKQEFISALNTALAPWAQKPKQLERGKGPQEEKGKTKMKWQEMVSILESQTRPVSLSFIAQILEPGVTQEDKEATKRASGLVASIKAHGYNLKKAGSGNNIRYYIGEDTKAEHSKSKVLTDLEYEILHLRLEEHLRKIINWLDKQREKGLANAVPVQSKTVAKNDKDYQNMQTVTSLRGSILGPIYDLAMSIRSVASPEEISQISPPQGGYRNTSFDNDVPRRASAMMSLMAKNDITLIIGQDQYKADNIPQNDPIWRFIIRAFDIADRLNLSKDRFLELTNNSLIEGDEVYILRYKIKK